MMQATKIIVLAHIKEFSTINLNVLSSQLNTPPSIIAPIIYELYERKIIYYEDNRFYVSDSIQEPLLTDTTWLSDSNETYSNENNFKWDFLYIPKNFDII